jgi:hypothetical protein
VLAGAALGGPPGEHGREPLDDLALVGILRPPLLVARPELVQRAASTVQPLPELLRGQVATRALIRDATELAGLDLELCPERGAGLTAARNGDADEDTQHEREGRGDDHRAAHGRSAGPDR